MQIRTLNQIVNELKEIANQHLQINSFNAGTLDDFATSGDTRYPAMWVSYENAGISSRTESFNFSIWIVDRVKKDRSNLIEVHSDCKSILNDIKAQLNDPGYGWSLGQDWNYQAIFEPFMEDEVAGWLADVTITQPFSNDVCQIPYNQTPIPGRASTQPTNGTVISSYVPTSRIITINGVSYDLQFDRSWTITGTTGVPYTGAIQNVDLGEYEIKVGQITLDTSPTGTAVVGTTRWNDSIGSIETTLKGGSVVIKNGVDLVARIVNKVSPNTTLTKASYQAVKISGAQGQRLAVELAQANNDNNSADTIGIVIETIAPNQEGFVITVGQIEDINTTGSLQGETWSDGDVLYLSPTTAGKLTNIKPTGLTGHIIVIGYVEYAHQNHGKIYVKIMNGWELDELHNVYINPSTLANNDILYYDSSVALWKNKAGMGEWIDYSATSTITGWSSFTAKELRYRVVGKQVFVHYYIQGTSNSTSTSFTLPHTTSAFLHENPNRSLNNGVGYHGFATVAASSSTAILYYWSTATNYTTTWTASGTKIIVGQLFYTIP